MTRTHILNYLADQLGFRSYLEIGVQNVRNNFRKVKCPIKVGVDPEVDDIHVFRQKSDDFFEMNKTRFDLIFIDGLHEYDQVKRDLENSLQILTPGGIIMLHDTLPDNERATLIPRQTVQWYGDVYKLVLDMAGRNDVRYLTVDTDCGCTIVWKQSNNPKKYELSWRSYLQNKRAMNIIAPHELQNHF